MAHFILFALASLILACEAKFPTGVAPCRKLLYFKQISSIYVDT